MTTLAGTNATRVRMEGPVALPTFSVLIATYNQAAYVRATLDSVAGQTCADFEVVIVDDGSTDGTALIVQEWMQEFALDNANRTVLLRQSNGGQSAAYEAGTTHCLGRYICLLDSDDRWLPTKLEAVYRLISRHPDAVLICHPVLVMTPDGSLTGRVRPSQAKLSRGDLRAHIRRTGRAVATVTSGMTVRADVLRDLMPMPTKDFRFGADGYIALAASLRGVVEVIAEPLALYRMHPAGQYIRRMMSRDGPRQTMQFQLVVARHLGLERAIRHGSYFARHAFAAAKLEKGVGEQVSSFGRLIVSTLSDESFAVLSRLMLAAFWTVCLVTPRETFFRLWKWFQLRHTGMDRVTQTTMGGTRTAVSDDEHPSAQSVR